MNQHSRLSAVLLFIWIAALPLNAAAGQTETTGRRRPVVRHHDGGKAEISGTGDAREYFKPDIAIITLGIETREKTASGAVAENGRKSQGIITALKGLINPAAGDSIKTSSFSLQPIYEYNPDTKKSLLTGYMVRNLVTVRTKEIEAAGHIIDEAVGKGANTVPGLSFAISEEKKYCDSVLKKAAERARKEAAYVAGLLGAGISGIKSISSSCGSEQPRPVFGRALAAKAVESAVPETAIESGDVAVAASVNVVFYLRQESIPHE